jgi:protein-S-isoprenylcysteine O-methyltransferase Ste14
LLRPPHPTPKVDGRGHRSGQVGQSGPIRCAKTRTPPTQWFARPSHGYSRLPRASQRTSSIPCDLFQHRFQVPGSAGAIFALAFALAIWAIVTIRKAGTQVETYKPTTTIVANGPYRFTRNPIYLGMVLGLIGLAIAFDSLWILATLVLFYLVIRYGVVVREEAYLERKFGDVYLGYKSRVRRWL